MILPLLLLAAAPTPLGYMNAGELADRCTASDPASVTTCYGYIAAVHDTVRAYEVWLGTSEFCPPLHVPQAELRRVFMTYIEAHRAARHGLAASAVVVALNEGFPCKAAAAPPAENKQR